MSKYTLLRSKKDIENLDKVRQFLHKKITNWTNYTTDSKLYLALPELFLNAVKENQDLKSQVASMTAKLQEYELLKNDLCRIKNFIERGER